MKLELSAGSLVPPGQLEAIGTIPGCTATLITKRSVLTAAHCVCPASNLSGCATRTTFTLHDVFPVNNPATAVDESKTRQDVSIQGSVRVHPEFGQRGWLREDIAVVDLDQSVTNVAPGVSPIPVAAPQDTPLPGDPLTLVGYGVSGSGCAQPSPGKQRLNLRVTDCNFAAILFRYDGQHTCGGDSGGPVLNGVGHVVGVASWSNFSSDSTYRPTSFSYNWIYGLPNPGWGACTWVKVGRAGLDSHQASAAWCPNGSFLAGFDLDGPRNISAHDAPVIGQALCCKLAGAQTTTWDACTWAKVEQGGLSSHQVGPAWCPNGSFITQVDLDRNGSASANDSPVVGQVRCCKLSGSQYARWGSSYWIGVEKMGVNSHQAGQSWCLDGAFITQFDLDGHGGLDDHDAPIVGQVKCSRPRP